MSVCVRICVYIRHGDDTDTEFIFTHRRQCNVVKSFPGLGVSFFSFFSFFLSLLESPREKREFAFVA